MITVLKTIEMIFNINNSQYLCLASKSEGLDTLAHNKTRIVNASTFQKDHYYQT